MNPFGAGDPAPDASVLDPRGRSEQLSTSWSDRPAVLVFLRYFGCPLCQQQVATLRADEDRFAEADTNVVLVGQGRPSDAERFVEEKSLPFRLLVDPTRAAFHAYGLIRGSFSQVFGPRVLVPMLRAAAQPESRQRLLNGGHLMQMPGTFVVDTAGIVHLAHRNVTIGGQPHHRRAPAGPSARQGHTLEGGSRVRAPGWPSAEMGYGRGDSCTIRASRRLVSSHANP